MWRACSLVLIATYGYGQFIASRDEVLGPWLRGDHAGTQRALGMGVQYRPWEHLVLRWAAEYEIERGNFAEALSLLRKSKSYSLSDSIAVFERREAKLRAAMGDFAGAERAALSGQRWDGTDLKKLKQKGPMALNALGQVYLARGLYRQALAIFDRSVKEAREGLLPESLEAKVMAAKTHLALGDAPAARALAEDALNLSLKTYGEHGPRTLDAKDALGIALAVQGRYTEADPLLANALVAREELYGRAHSKTAESYLHGAQSLAAQRQFAKAVEFATEAVRLIREALPAPNARTALVLAEAAGIDIAAGQPDDAREKLRAAGQLLALHLGEDVPSVREINQKLAALPASRPLPRGGGADDR